MQSKINELEEHVQKIRAKPINKGLLYKEVLKGSEQMKPKNILPEKDTETKEKGLEVF